MASAAPVVWPSKWERRGLVLLVVVLVLFGVVVDFRSAFLKRHMGDLGVYLRAAWAVRTGADPYTVTDNDWHYSYPPLLAILMVPLADPPPGAAATGMIPFAVSAALWYVFGLGCLALAVHWLASALEQTSANPEVRSQPRGCRRWWALRLVPILACMSPIGHTLMRGQTNLLVLALLCGMAAATLHGRRLLAGVCLAGAICIKVYPVFLLLFPLWRRDGRCLLGCALGLFLGLLAIPAGVFGPERTMILYQEWTEVLLRPALALGEDKSRAKELIEVTATDSQSLLAALHNTLHLDRWTRPHQASRTVRLAAYLIGGVLTLITLLAARRRQNDSAPRTVIFLGMLILCMLLLSPVCHLHYFCLSLLLLMGFLAMAWERDRGAGYLGNGWRLLLGANFVVNALPGVPGLDVLRDVCLAMYAALLLWLVGVVLLCKHWPEGCSERIRDKPSLPRVAA
jgi:hypothetical protein